MARSPAGSRAERGRGPPEPVDAPGTSGADPRVPAPVPLPLRYAKYLVVGFTGVFVNLVVFSLVLGLVVPADGVDLARAVERLAVTTSSNPFDNFVASTAAFAVATLSNFAFNNAWTFRTSGTLRHRVHERLGLYFGVSLASLAINEIVLFALGGIVPPLYGQAVGIAAGSVVGFAGNLRVSFAEARAAVPPLGPTRAPVGEGGSRAVPPSAWPADRPAGEPSGGANR